MKNYKLYYTILVFSLLCFGCETIYEYPNENPVDPIATDISFDIRLDLELPFDCQQDVTTRSSGGKDMQEHKVRVIIEIYPDKYPGTENIAPDTYESEAYVRQELILENISGPEQTITAKMKLSPTPYIFLVWADFITGEPEPKDYYTANRLHTIRLCAPYQSNTRYRDAFTCSKRIDLSPYAGQRDVKLPETLTLHRPLAKYEIVTTDVEKFFQEASKNNRTLSLSALSDYKVKISYRSYFPCGFDAITDKPNDARTGTTYEAQLTQITDTSAIIAFDYVLTNGTGSFVIADIQIYDNEGNPVKKSYDIRIPYQRNLVTRIYGSFLTKNYGSGVTINPDYDGEFNIYL